MCIYKLYTHTHIYIHIVERSFLFFILYAIHELSVTI